MNKTEEIVPEEVPLSLKSQRLDILFSLRSTKVPL